VTNRRPLTPLIPTFRLFRLFKKVYQKALNTTFIYSTNKKSRNN